VSATFSAYKYVTPKVLLLHCCHCHCQNKNSFVCLLLSSL